MYKLVFFVPVEFVEAVKQAVFAAGAGVMGDYEQCCWQTRGLGQFKPMEGSAAFIGEVGQVETVEEFRVEMVCDDQYIRAAIEALRQAHPYEEPAFDVWRLSELSWR